MSTPHRGRRARISPNIERNAQTTMFRTGPFPQRASALPASGRHTCVPGEVYRARAGRKVPSRVTVQQREVSEHVTEVVDLRVGQHDLVSAKESW
jgi:hypothetical protein